MAEAAGGGPSLPEDLVFYDILTRLPAKPVLRCRAVCRSWGRRLTTDTKFLLAHHRRQPSLPLVTEGDRTTEKSRINVLDHRTSERRPVARTTGGTGGAEADLWVHASCDGLLVLKANGCPQICNPATRQCAPLTLLHGATEIAALYHHPPSGSYRVLVCFDRAHGDGHAMYHVHTVGSRELSCVGEPPGAWGSRNIVGTVRVMAHYRPPVVANGRVYWQPLMLDEGNPKFNNILAFDTMAESFQQLLLPMEGSFVYYFELFQMNSGALELYHYPGCGTVDLWVLQDHESWSWSKKHQIKLSGSVHSLFPVLDQEGDVLGLSNRERSQGIVWQHLHHISGANGSLLARYEWSTNLLLSRHWYKESLVQHDFFSMENDGAVDEKPLFDGLSTVELVRDDNYKPSHNEKQMY